MAKAEFHKNQRVYVVPVSTWALIEHVMPHWAKGVDEPIKVTYDVGLGRDFDAVELEVEEVTSTSDLLAAGGDKWRLVRAPNKWRTVEECSNHPFPGTYPVVVTSKEDWGGWRVPGAEYDLNPHQAEAQARLIANAPQCASLLRKISDYVEQHPKNISNQLMEMNHLSRKLLEAIGN